MAAELEPPAYAVHLAGPFDLGRLAKLHRSCFDDPWTKTDLAHLLALPGGLGLIVRTEGLRRLGFETRRSIGFSLCRVARDESELLSLGVAPWARRLGIGTLLVRDSTRRCQMAGAQRMFLEVAVDNPEAHALYRQEGFEEVGRREGYYRRANGQRVTAVTMRADL